MAAFQARLNFVVRQSVGSALLLLLFATAAAGQAPQRIVSLIPATTEMLFDMGAGSRVIGVGNYDQFPPEVTKLPHVGGLLDPDTERIISLRPDLVIVYTTQNDLRQQLDRAKIPTFVYEHKALPDIMATMRALGARIDAPGAESAAARMDQQLAAIAKRVAGRPRPKTLLVFGRDPGVLRRIAASGGYGFLHDLLELAGGADVLADTPKQSVDMSTEMILTRAPEVIIELHYGETKVQDMEKETLVWNGLPSVPAVKNGRVYLLNGQQFVVPGPRIVSAVETFARTLHPGAFK